MRFIPLDFGLSMISTTSHLEFCFVSVVLDPDCTICAYFFFFLEIDFSIAIFGLGGLDWTWIGHLRCIFLSAFLISYLDRWNWSTAWLGLNITSTAYFFYISFSSIYSFRSGICCFDIIQQESSNCLPASSNPTSISQRMEGKLS